MLAPNRIHELCHLLHHDALPCPRFGFTDLSGGETIILQRVVERIRGKDFFKCDPDKVV